MQQTHIIHKQIAEITFGNKAEVQVLFHDMSKLLNSQISQCMERVLDRMVPEDTLISLDLLEVDLGVMALPLNEIEFVNKYEVAFEKALGERMEKLNKSIASWEDGVGVTEYRLNPAALLHHFLLQGVLPSWGAGASMNTPEAILASVLKFDGENLKTMLLSIGCFERVRVRMVNQFSAALIQDLIQLLEPIQASYIISYHKDIVQLQQHNQLLKTEVATFEKSLWNFILTYLLVEMGSQFERKMFVKSTLAQLAAHFNLTYQEVLQLFAQVASSQQHLVQANLPSFILELMEETNQREPQPKPADKAPFLIEDGGLREDEVLIYYFFYGSLPFSYHHYSFVYLHKLLALEIKERPERIQQMLNKRELSQQISWQLAHQLPDDLLLELVNLQEPTQTTFIAHYHRTLLSVQKKKSIVKAEESEFRKALWQFIMVFLLNDRGSLFNTKSFVESNTRQMANHYNMSFTNLLLFLTQGIGEEMVNNNNSSTFFYIVSELLRKQKQVQTPLLATDKLATEAPQSELERTKERLFIHNTLLFWFTKGYMPWWSHHSKVSPEAQFANFITSHPKQAVLLWQQATQQGIARALSLSKMAEPLSALLKRVPDGEIALSRIKLFEQIALAHGHHIDQKPLLEALFRAVCITYNESHFLRFDTMVFLTRFMDQLKKLTGKQQPIIAKQIIAALRKYETAQTVSTANTLLKILKADNTSSTNCEAENLCLQSFDVELLVVDGVTLLAGSAHHQLTKALELVGYYLLHNCFPPTVLLTSEAQSNYLLQRLILFIYQHDSAKLTHLIDGSTNSPLAQLRLHDVFAVETNQLVRNVAWLLAPFKERDILHYIHSLSSNSLNTTQLATLLKSLDKHSSATERKKLYQTMMQSPTVVQYLASHYKGEVYDNLLRQLTNSKSMEVVKTYAYLLALAVGDSYEREKLQLHLREFSLGWFSASSSKGVDYFFTHFLKHLAQKLSWNMVRLQEQLSVLYPKLTNLNRESLLVMTKQMQDDALQYVATITHQATLHKEMQEQEQQLMKASLGTNPQDLTQASNTKTSLNQLIMNERELAKSTKLIGSEHLFVNNAGMVLLHPFLSTFLTRVGICQGGQFVSDEVQHRAVHLLQYLINNALETPEHELVLNKVLCGLPIEEPIANAIDITELEQTTAHDLLKAVIQNWDKMSNSSVEGLQGSFLQREGMLSENDQEWTLKIEQRTYDLLLQTLPWGLSMIKYPWMNKPLMVEWA